MALKHREDLADLHFVDGLVAIDIDISNREDKSARLRGLVEGDETWGLAGRERLAEEFGDPDLVDRVTEHIDVMAVDDPVAAAETLNRQDGVSASPIHALGFSWHKALTATRPQASARDVAFNEIPPGSRAHVIAVVDTGIVDAAAVPSWISSSVIYGKGDLEPLEVVKRRGGDVSHGTFVTSLMRQIAPTHVVSMARAASVEDGYERSDHHPEPDPTTEFHVADAVHRLIERHRGGDGAEALNLSVGGTTVPTMEMVTLRSALARWRVTFPKAPIFAAAGNTPASDVIYPAAFRYVRGVAAANRSGGQIVWDDEENEVTPTPVRRDWVDDVAPGSHLIGLGGRKPHDVVQWSGSSFATAVATASFARGGPVEVRDGIAYWPNRAMRYGDVPGLEFA